MVGDLNRNMDKRDRGRPGAAAHIGILALQGDFQAHGKTLDRLGWAWIEVRRAADLDGLRGLVLPGGESTTMRRLMEGSGLDVALQQFAAGGGAVYGTCAGAILLAQRVTNPSGHGLGVLDVDVERNSYGRQTESCVRLARLDAPNSPAIEAVLIRAPRIVRVGRGVTVHAWIGSDPVWVEEGRISVTTFHPELSDETRCHARFLDSAAQAPRFTMLPVAMHPAAAAVAARESI
jgi:5'-phosphate synthase pdxT subunit